MQKRKGSACCLLLAYFTPENGGNILLSNVRLSLNYTTKKTILLI
jgi:hypothetical protein